MTAHEALEAAKTLTPVERAGRHETTCRPRGRCRDPLTNDPGRWTWCPDGLTVFDDYGKPVNPIAASPIDRARDTIHHGSTVVTGHVVGLAATLGAPATCRPPVLAKSPVMDP